METDHNQRLGRYEISTAGGETVRAYLPPPLPPVPALRLETLQVLLEQANQARWEDWTAWRPYCRI
jgi:hypothetical protein